MIFKKVLSLKKELGKLAERKPLLSDINAAGKSSENRRRKQKKSKKDLPTAAETASKRTLNLKSNEM